MTFIHVLNFSKWSVTLKLIETKATDAHRSPQKYYVCMENLLEEGLSFQTEITSVFTKKKCQKLAFEDF